MFTLVGELNPGQWEEAVSVGRECNIVVEVISLWNEITAIEAQRRVWQAA